MRIRVTALLAMAVVCLSAGIEAQVVNEEASSAELTEEGLTVSLAVENLGKEFQSRLTVEILDNEGKVVSSEYSDLRVREGRRNYSIPLPVPELNPDDEDGIFWHRLRYRIGQAHGIVSLSELLKGVIEVTVISPDEIRPGQIFKARVRTRAPFTKKPVPNASIRASLGIDIETDDDEDTLELLGSGITDERGFAVLEFRIPEGIVIDYVEDLKITVEKNGLVRTVEKNLSESEEEGNIFLTTDKPIYQPGQTFGVRALIFDSAKTVVTGEELEFAIYDEEDTLLFRETVESSEYGIASVSWAIPENAKLGTYRIEVEGDDEFNGGERTFKVTRYDLPNFAVTAKPDKPFYLPGDKEAVIEVSADYLFGKPVPEGHVKVVLESGRKWNWRNQAYDIEESQKLEGKTDSDGRFRARIDLTEETAELARANWRRFSDLHLAAYYTDPSTNRTEQRRFDIRISKEPIHVYLMTRLYGVHSQLPITAYVSAFYADGRPAKTTVRMVGKENGRGDSSFAELARTETNAYGAGRIAFTRPDFGSVSDDLDLKLTATDGSGAVGTFEDTIYFNDRPGITVSTGQAIQRPGEPIELDIRSTIKEGTVYVDVMRDWDAVATVDAVLKNGKANIVIPYDPAFSGALHIWAYTEYTDDGDLEIARANTAVIYPEQKNLLLDASFGAVSYKPGASADAVFSVKDGAGKPAQSALGVVIFDRAVEERARTDAEFGSYFGRFGDWLGLSQRFGGVTLKELNELNIAEPPAEDLQLAAEVLLGSSGGYYFPRIERSEIEPTAPGYVFRTYFKTQFGPIESALKRRYEEDFDHPVDEASLERILQTFGLDLRDLKDPWGQSYRSSFTVYRSKHLVAFKSAGADKKFGTRDDLTVSHMEFEYFPKIGNAIREAAVDMRSNLGSYIRDYGTLRDVLRGKGIDLDAARDPWGNPYVFIFDVSGRKYTIEVRSTGPDGKRETDYWRGDDFQLHYSAIDYFSETEQRITTILSEERNDDAWVFPETEDEFWELVEKNGIPRGSILDGFGRPVFVTTYERWEYSDKETVSDGKLSIKPVTQKVRFIEIRSTGRDGIRNDEGYGSDDFTLATFSTVTIQRLRSQAKSRGVIKKISYTGSSGAISGKVTDQTGAVIPGAIVTVSREADGFSDSKATDASGIFLFENLSTGSYKLEATADGFQKMVYSDIRVKAYSLTEIDITLEIGGVSAVVDVQGASETINTSDAQITTSTTVERSEIPGTGVQMETPRLREYFPETLVWAPEVITDEQGRAELKFKMADNITTWKMYTVASTKNGKIGVSENEITAFQPFFADLEPPKFLTTGDEIHLPVQIRNYTPNAQPVNVTMDDAGWFSFLGEKEQKIEVPSNASENAVFGFRADRAINGGKQRVTAIATGDSDAIEKPVTVRPNGQEITETETRLFSDSAAFNADIPANAIGEGLDTRVRIYPNLLANVADSADGLLKRPYGCGEQTISSTYPNLMILKLAPEESRLRAKAEEYLRKGYERLLAYQVSSGGF
ncbi:MAG: carboxypeptidase regulatory-like domain-containing protein, partial [Aridibacter famidurans]|nr:carboxypeptidase regulatory-like domain-containing protein [Aridibacter famidurans]